MVDLGIVTDVRDGDKDEDIREPKGTPVFMSLFQHSYKKQSYRDDLQSLFFTFIFLLLKKEIPWINVGANSKDKSRKELKRFFDEIMALKVTFIEKLR